MCVFAFALDCHPRWRLLLAGNRDEFHLRASAGLSRWDDATHVLGGRDLVSGGSWLGLSEKGRVAVVTNISTSVPRDHNKASRGLLVANWLIHGALPNDAALAGFNAFSLLAVGAKAELLSNHPTPMRLSLSAGLHSLSNGILGERWGRRERLQAALGNWLSTEADAPLQLFDLLRPKADDAEQPLFMVDSIYGTRCSSIIAVDHAGLGMITERRFDEAGVVVGENSLIFRWP